jgi:hypothetical protein
MTGPGGVPAEPAQGRRRTRLGKPVSEPEFRTRPHKQPGACRWPPWPDVRPRLGDRGMIASRAGISPCGQNFGPWRPGECR